ncbi:MAG: TIGR03905 family TSCPD domain-containing protein [Muribaculaceae bacterium]|nr:TIGR03905 family TSCPD domain-containing protein [Muribaculaceae bacterium]
MKHHYTTSGTCSRSIEFEIDPITHIVRSVAFSGGCNGNLKGIAAMSEGLRAEDVIDRLKGIKCGAKPTSCPDQFASALEQTISDLNSNNP